MRSAVEAAFASSTSEELLSDLARCGVPAGRIRSLNEVYAWDQVVSQGLTMTVNHERLGDVTLPGPPLRFFDTDDTETSRTRHKAPPVLDADGASIRAWLWLPSSESSHSDQLTHPQEA